MIHPRSGDAFETHAVDNPPPEFAPRDLWATDIALREAVEALGGAVINLRDHWHHNLLSKSWVIGHFALVAIGLALLLRATWFA